MTPDFDQPAYDSTEGPTPQQPPLAQRASQPPRRRGGCGLLLLVLLVIFFAGTSFVLLMALAAVSAETGRPTRPGPRTLSGRYSEVTLSGDPASEFKLLLIPIEGVIMDGGASGLSGSEPGMVSVVRDMLRAAADDPNVKGVLLRVDSPGGGVTASDIIYHELTRFRRETNKPVVALFGDVAASGGYYVASAADHIVAHPTCVTGSIGVIMPLIGIQGLLQKVGVEPRIIKSGEFKDMGSMYKEIPPEERQMFQAMADEYHGIFVSKVQQGFRNRGVQRSDAEIAQYCDGRIFTGQQAKDLQFVDQLGYYEDAVAVTENRAGVPAGQAQVITYARRPGLLEALLAGPGLAEGNTVKVEIEGMPKFDGPRFMYLWTVTEQATPGVSP